MVSADGASGSRMDLQAIGQIATIRMISSGFFLRELH